MGQEEQKIMEKNLSCKNVKTVDSWDSYYYELCKTVSMNSKCLSRQIGAIIVRDKSIICTGYNSPPRGIPTCSERYLIDKALRDLLRKRNINPDDPLIHSMCPRRVLRFKSGEGIEWCVAGHAEENCILNAARMGICTKDTIMYMSCGIPCSKCLIKIINAGIIECVVTSFEVYDKVTPYLLDNGDLKIRMFDF